ncbi:uncharacterized protein METZ01_LOCUS325644 [marine metagenome]|uniref:Uncharacterized protein n=1 Tax=marine metagenome TaxID=408172 RepID=A0A382PJ33_9ZZZZ
MIYFISFDILPALICERWSLVGYLKEEKGREINFRLGFFDTSMPF